MPCLRAQNCEKFKEKIVVLQFNDHNGNEVSGRVHHCLSIVIDSIIYGYKHILESRQVFQREETGGEISVVL